MMEWIDTLFLILQKKPVIFLHWYVIFTLLFMFYVLLQLQKQTRKFENTRVDSVGTVLCEITMFVLPLLAQVGFKPDEKDVSDFVCFVFCVWHDKINHTKVAFGLCFCSLYIELVLFFFLFFSVFLCFGVCGECFISFSFILLKKKKDNV